MYAKESTKVVNDFIKEKDLKDYYMNIDSLLEYYSPGLPKMKPDVLEQMIKIEETRRKHAENMMSKNAGSGQIIIQQGDKQTALNNNQAVDLMKQQQHGLQQQNMQLQQLKNSYEAITKENMELKKNLLQKDNTIIELQKLNTNLLSQLSEKKEV